MSAPSETIQPTPSSRIAVPPVTPNEPPHVLIGGAGLAGLFLGILLERAGIPYEIFERSAEPRSPNILPAFEQLGLLDELLSFSKPSFGVAMLTDKLKLIGKPLASNTDIIGYDRVLFSRPDLHNMLFKKIPKEKIHMSKKIVTLDQDQDGVTVTFDDNTTARGDILVGADGAHSAVRQHLYKTLEMDGLLPKSDTEDTSKGYISLLGTTSSLDPSNNKKMLDEIRHFKTPYGTMGDLFDVTDIEKVSKVYFEDKLFETWTHGRTVLIGDGAGAVNAMQDAVLLANYLYDITPTNFKNIKTALSDYKNERFEAIKDQYPQSHISAKLIFGHTLWERIIRYIVFNWLPASLQRKQMVKDTAYRPQANFLPKAPKRGTMDTIPQNHSKRIQREKGEQETKERAAVLAI
ncbi:hypothetical protein KI688_007607 [Linnemannia hyalina]|uniref:FAD-binding domain-containing protein n=1 Tax=Linnemannia hyalina TaxID=64524 RepID=A0A9P8BM45_9FUNG|nr:hypothetical protein KI688_007607 [Linnemannia hyalina]